MARVVGALDRGGRADSVRAAGPGFARDDQNAGVERGVTQLIHADLETLGLYCLIDIGQPGRLPHVSVQAVAVHPAIFPLGWEHAQRVIDPLSLTAC